MKENARTTTPQHIICHFAAKIVFQPPSKKNEKVRHSMQDFYRKYLLYIGSFERLNIK